MFAQLFLGVYFVIRGISEYFSKPNLFTVPTVFEATNKENLPVYLKKIGMAHIYLGLLFIMMGQIEYWYNPEPKIFITTYITLGGLFVLLITFINKKYTGDYRL